jgi:hypothetical protein
MRGSCLVRREADALGNGYRHWTKSAAVGWLLNTQLCPIIWALILALETVLVYKARPPLPVNGCNLCLPFKAACILCLHVSA